MFTVAFIGAGKMAQALAAAMQQAGLLSGVRAVDPVPEAIDQLSKRLGNALRVEEHPSAAAAAEGADACFLAVKPQDVASAAADLGETATLIVSIMAGVSLASLRERLPNARLARVMPNTPCLVGQMAAGYTFAPEATDADRHAVSRMLAAAGLAIEVAEEQLDAITALSASGPAFFARLLQWYADAGQRQGLPADIAIPLTLQTAVGTAELLRQLQLDPDSLVEMVSSRGGTTVAGRAVLEASGVAETLAQTVAAATARSRELGEQSRQST